MRRKLSNIEHILDGNFGCVVRLEGTFSLDQLRSALSRLQHKHPALRALIREERDGLYYEENSAPEIPLRVVPRGADGDYWRECQAELTTEFAYDLPQLRAVWLRSDRDSDLLLTTSHRICDGMSIIIIAREVLRSLHSDEALIPYEPVTTQDIIGDYQPPQPWKRKLKAFLLNGLLLLIPNSRRAPDNNEHHLEWKADRALLAALKKRCKAEGVVVHAALLVIVERALFGVLKEKFPKWIANQIDPRRRRFAALKNDMLFFGGGGFKVGTEQAPNMKFWERARAIHKEMRGLIDQELLKIPDRFHFFEMLRPLSNGQAQSIVRLLETLKTSDRLDGFALSNLGDIVLLDGGAPIQVKDFRVYIHSFKTKLLGLVPYVINGEMRFYFVADEKCMRRGQAEAFKREFMAVLQSEVIQADSCGGDPSLMLAAVAD
ncbi:MAG: condensation domain protein [Edaphobacter sp.]|nr:condensation domain protein [Edaphobacter sp.]